ncbi:hypothetical protein ACH4FX_42585 [Streptomyces sp. NPDC018019]|uniref:hypothetical protein n=1 Tax=Streptomyces sp. NPDC018019 TaxID=3365030 RepID=UPI003790577B
MRVFRPAVVALAGLTFATTLSMGEAFASKGSFIWLGPDNKSYVIANPPNSRCLTMQQRARGARNETNAPAVLFSGKKCNGRPTPLAPGKHAPRSAAFSSVRFG